MNDWYLGPLGELRALPVPEPGMEIIQVRYGGTHQGLSGARVQDTTGRRVEYNLEFEYLNRAEYFWIDAMFTGHVPGPYRLLDPLKKNRLSPPSTHLGRGIGMEDVLTYSRSYPPQVGIPGRSYVLSGWESSTYTITFEPGKATVVLPNETITASIYLRANTTHGATLQMQMLDADLVVLDTQSVPASLTADWARFSITRTVPTGCAAIRFRVMLGSANTAVYMAAPQVEAGSVATAWETGGGAPVVVIDQMPASSPIFPLRNCSLKLLEV
jgi:hypothetical protein